MKLRNLFLTAVAGILAFCGCDLFENDKPLLGITVEPDQVEIARLGGGCSIEIKTDQAWTITVPREADWLLVDPLSGTGTQYVNLYAEANNGKLRSATIIVKAGYDMVPVTVNQPGGIDSGDGLTMETAFSASEARIWVNNNLASGEVTSTKYYVKGIIHKVQTTFEGSGTYGNATFFISDDGQASQEDFECYQIYYLGGRKWKSGDKEVAVGDEVIVYGPLTNYDGKPETDGKGAACLVKLNEVVEAPQEPEDPTTVEQITCAEFIQKADQNTTYRLVGEVTSNVNTTYCSFDMNDGTATVVVWTVNNKDEWKDKVKKGGTVTVRGKYKPYTDNNGNTKHEMVDAYIEDFTDGGDTPGPGGEDVDPAGDGTVDNPYNVAAAVSAVANLTWTSNTDYQKVGPYYVKGKVSDITQNFDASGDFGNATFNLVDVDGGSNKLACYRILYFNGQKYVAGQTPLPAVGSEVIVYSELMNYRGNTPETVANVGYVYSIDGVTEAGGETPPGPGGDDNPAGNGTVDNPYNIAAAASAVANLTWTSNTDYQKVGPYYVKGKVSAITQNFDASGDFGNATFDLVDVDGGSKLTCYRILYFKGEKYVAGQTPLPAVGSEVIVYSELMNYKGNTPETIANVGYVYSIDGVTEVGGETPPGPGGDDNPAGNGTVDNPYNIAAAASAVANLTWTSNTDYQKVGPYYVKGKVSDITQNFDASGDFGNATFNLVDVDGGAKLTCYRILYFKGEKYVAGQTPLPAVGSEVIVYSELMNYKGNTPETIANVGYVYSIDGVTEVGGGGETPPTEETLTVSEILALETGKACDSKPSLVVALTARGFVATDGTKSIYVYTQGTDFNGAAKIGDMVKFSGVKAVYNNMPEVTPVTSVEVVSSNNEVSYPNPKDITESAGTYTATEAEFVSLTGTLTKSGNYYNIALDAFADDGSKMGTLVFPVDDLNAASFEGKKVTVTGYFNGLTSNNTTSFISIIATKIEEVEQPGEATLTNVTASFTETQLSASWNTVQGADYYQWMLYKLTDDGQQMESESYLAYGLTTHTSITSTIGRNTSASDNKEEWSVSSLVNGKYAVVVIAMSRQQGETQGTQIDMKAAGARYYYNLKVSGLECKDGVVSASWKAYAGENLAYYRWQLQLIRADGTRENVAMGNITGTSINETIGQTWEQDENNKTAWYVTALEAGDYYFGVLACSSDNKILEQSEGTDHFTYSGSSQNESRTVEIVISEYAAANNWTNGTKYTSVQKDGVTFTVSGGNNSGKYYTSGTNWRLYQADTPSPTLTISAGDNYELVSVKIEYESVNTGVLTFDGSNLSSGQQVAFGAGIHRASYGVGNSGTATNGQARITKMTVVIK